VRLRRDRDRLISSNRRGGVLPVNLRDRLAHNTSPMRNCSIGGCILQPPICDS
jgi:hypothetical protein